MCDVQCVCVCVYDNSLLTTVSEASGCDDRHGHHDKPAAAPHVLHEELLDHDVPESFGQNQIHLICQSTVALLQLVHLHLEVTKIACYLHNHFS